MTWNMTVVWLALLIVFVIVELLTLGLTCLWFAFGAIAAVAASLFDLPVWVQILLFIVISVVTLFFTRPLAIRFFNREREKTNVESLIGKQVIVISEVDNLMGIGQVTVNGQEWSARSEDNSVKMPIGSVGEVVGVSGVKLIIRRKA